MSVRPYTLYYFIPSSTFAHPSLEHAARDALGGLTPATRQAFPAMFVGKPVWIADADFF
jgi:hypothetical protein